MKISRLIKLQLKKQGLNKNKGMLEKLKIMKMSTLTNPSGFILFTIKIMEKYLTDLIINIGKREKIMTGQNAQISFLLMSEILLTLMITFKKLIFIIKYS